MRIAINGLGRIGRMVLKAGLDDLDFVAVNDLAPLENLVYLLKYDSVFGKYEKDVRFKKGKLLIEDKEINVYNEKKPVNLPWSDLDVDVVVESTGVFRTKKRASQHLKAGAKKVLVSAPCRNVPDIVYGVNESIYDGDDVLSNASCTTNCLAPIVHVLHKKYGIKKGLVTTVHAYTSSQNIIDGPHKKFRRGRAAALNIVPTTTGAASAVTRVIPELEGKLDGMAIRVPVLNGSVVDLVVDLEKDVDAEGVNKLFEDVSKNEMNGIIEYSQDPVVSSDIIGNSHSAIVDSKSTKKIDNMFKILAWYDNEWGFSCRMIDVIKNVF